MGMLDRALFVKARVGIYKCDFTRLFHNSPVSLHQRPSHLQPKKIAGVKQVIAVSSNKGGVGKSTSAGTLQISLLLSKSKANLKRRGISVGLLDLDVFGPSFPRLLNLNHRPELNEEKKMVPLENYGVQIMSMGFLTPNATAASWRGPMLISAVNQLLFGVQWNDIDVLVLDLPPGTGDTQISVVQNVQLTGAIIVSTPQQLALEDVTRGIDLYQKCSVPLVGIIENMSYWQCKECSTKEYIFGEGHVRKVAESFNIPFLGEVALTAKISKASDEGIPVTVAEPEGQVAQQYTAIAEKVATFLSKTQTVGPTIEFK